MQAGNQRGEDGRLALVSWLPSGARMKTPGGTAARQAASWRVRRTRLAVCHRPPAGHVDHSFGVAGDGLVSGCRAEARRTWMGARMDGAGGKWSATGCAVRHDHRPPKLAHAAGGQGPGALNRLHAAPTPSLRPPALHHNTAARRTRVARVAPVGGGPRGGPALAPLAPHLGEGDAGGGARAGAGGRRGRRRGLGRGGRGRRAGRRGRGRGGGLSHGGRGWRLLGRRVRGGAGKDGVALGAPAARLWVRQLTVALLPTAFLQSPSRSGGSSCGSSSGRVRQRCLQLRTDCQQLPATLAQGDCCQLC